MSKIAVIGMVGNSAFLSVDCFHKAGETVKANSIHFEPGGKGFNQAVAAARYGSKVAFLGAVGNEYVSEIESFLLNENIAPILVRKNDSTAFASILTDKTGANRVTVYQGARLEKKDLDVFKEYIFDADILLINNEVPQEVNEYAISLAKKADTYVIMNPAPSVNLSDYIRENVDLFTPNEHELVEVEDRENVIVTLGAKGCLIKETGEIVDAFVVDKVVDTTGAGDTFNGVLANALSSGKTISEAVRTAVIASGVSVTKKYAASSIPTSFEVDEYIKNKNR